MADKLTIIHDEVQNDPASRGYAGKTPAAQAILINDPLSQSPQVFTNQLVNPQKIVEVLIRRAKWKGIVDVTGSNTNAFYCVELMKLSSIPIDSQDSAIITLFTNLVSAGLLTAADTNALKPLYQVEVKVSRGQVLGIGEVTQSEVEKAFL